MTHIKNKELPAGAALDEAHIGAIHGAFGTYTQAVLQLKEEGPAPAPIDRSGSKTWLMPPLHRLAPARMTMLAKMRLYLVVAGGMVLMRIGSLALHGQ